MAKQPHFGPQMKSRIEGAVKEKEKAAEGKAEFEPKKPELLKEIEAKAKQH